MYIHNMVIVMVVPMVIVMVVPLVMVIAIHMPHTYVYCHISLPTHRIRILICTVASVSSFILVAAAEIEALIILGVVCASIGSGFGEIVFLSFTSFFDKSTVSAWSSGTG